MRVSTPGFVLVAGVIRPVMRQQVAFWKHVESLEAASCRSARVPISAQTYWLADLVRLRVLLDAAR